MSSAGLVAALADRYRIERELRGDALEVGLRIVLNWFDQPWKP